LKVIPIHKKKDELQQLLETFRKSLEVADFLAAVEYCLKNRIEDCSVLEAEWEARQQKVSFTDGMECLSKLLAKIKVEYPAVERVTFEKTERTINSSAELMVSAVKEQMIVEEDRKSQANKYGWFYPSFLINNTLTGIYPDEIDPGQIIAKYLKQFFPTTLPNAILNHQRVKAEKVYEILFDSGVSTFVLKIAKLIVIKAYPNEVIHFPLICCCRDVLDPKNRERRTQHSEMDLICYTIHVATLLLPKDLFYAWHDAMIEQLHELNALEHDEFITNFSIVALHKFSFCFNSKPIMAGISFNNISGEKPSEEDDQALEYIATEKYLSFDDLFSWFYINCAIAVNESEEFKSVAGKLICDLTQYRRKYLAGIFPADMYSSSSIALELVDIVGHQNADLLVMLSEGDFNSILCLFPDDDNHETHQQRCYVLEKAQRYYITLLNKALEEGVPELGVALLSIYVLLRTIIEKGRFANLPELMLAIEKALLLPGSKTLKHTLSFTVDSIDKYFGNDPIATCSAAYFRPYLTKQAELHTIEGGSKEPFGIRQSEKYIREFFETELGVERWEKLSQNSQKCLVSAELQWRNSAIEFGFGIKDWSGLITTYCKAIEGELVGRLHDFFVSPEYEAHLGAKGLKRPAKPTAGWLLKELKSYEQMTPELLAVLNTSKIRLAGDNDLINRLYDIVQNYRNISAHHDAVSMKRYAEFKEKMFQSGLLQRFIDAFVE